jgi:hypothetical protein
LISRQKESSSDTGTLSDEFSSSLLEETKTFYMALQKEDITDSMLRKQRQNMPMNTKNKNNDKFIFSYLKIIQKN